MIHKHNATGNNATIHSVASKSSTVLETFVNGHQNDITQGIVKVLGIFWNKISDEIKFNFEKH